MWRYVMCDGIGKWMFHVKEDRETFDWTIIARFWNDYSQMTFAITSLYSSTIVLSHYRSSRKGSFRRMWIWHLHHFLLILFFNNFFFMNIFFLCLILDNIDHIHKRELVCRYHHICDWQSPEVLRRTQRVSDSFPGRWNLITHSKIWCDSLENSC